MSLIRYTAPSLANYLAATTPAEKKAAPVEAKAPAPEAPRAPGDSVDIQTEPAPTTPGPGAGGGYDGDEVPSDDDGPGAGGGYDRDAIPADDDGPGPARKRKGPGPAESDGPGAGGGYASITGIHHRYEVGPIAAFWAQPLTVFNATANINDVPSYLPLSSFNDYASYLLGNGHSDNSSWAQNGPVASLSKKAAAPVKKTDGKP